MEEVNQDENVDDVEMPSQVEKLQEVIENDTEMISQSQEEHDCEMIAKMKVKTIWKWSARMRMRTVKCLYISRRKRL